MNKVYIIFWSGGGNTAAMADAVEEGARTAGAEAILLQPSEAKAYDFTNVQGLALGCPAMGVEVLERTEMEPFVERIESVIAGKKLALFGSYGWGDGEWMRDWEDRMKHAGATVIGGKGIIAHEAPDADALDKCRVLGRELAQL